MEELYNALVEQGKYTKSFEDFKAQFSAPEKTKMLYESLNSSGDYTKSFENFTSQFGFAEKKKIKSILLQVVKRKLRNPLQKRKQFLALRIL